MTADDRRPNLIETLLDLLAELEDHDAAVRTGRWSGRGGDIDYAISVRGLDGPCRPPTPSERGESPHGITTRETDTGVTVVADLSPLTQNEDEIDIELAGGKNRLVIQVSGEHIGDIPLDDSEWDIADVTLNNGILAVELTHA